MKRAGMSLLLAGVLLALIQFTGCADTPATFNKVTIVSPRGAQIIGQGQTVSIQVSVLNDTGAGGVTFAPVGFGTVTQTSPTTATYTAPNVVTAETVVKIVITSVDFANQSATLTITVEPPPTITTTSLPTAPLNGTYNAPVTATGGVPPLSWVITAGTLPAGLKLSDSTTNTVQITGKATAGGSSIFTIMITDSTGASSSQQLTIVVSSLAITTTSPLPPGTVGTPYDPPGLQFTATGGTGTDTWTVASGSTLPGGLTLSSTGVLSGTPTVGGTFTFGITATDSATPPAVVTATFTLVISQQQQLTLLNGSYAFEFSGYGANGFVAFAGTFTANGLGGITTGEMDFNSQLGTPLNFTNLLGSYTAGTDGRGTFTFTNTTLPTAPIFAFSVDSSGNGRFIEFDSSTTRGSGRFQLQTVTSCVVSNTVTNTYAGDFAFGGSGFASQFAANNAGPLAFAGRFTAIPPVAVSIPGSLTQGEMDTNAPGITTIDDQTVSGTYLSGPDNTHCTLALSSAGLANQNYSIYPISSNDAFIIETDTVSGVTTTPYLSVGEMIQQIGQPFVTGGVLSGTMVGGLSGQIISGTTFSPEVQVIQISSTSGSTSFQILQEDNQAGTVFSTNGTATTDPYTSDSLGRLQGSIEFNSTFSPVFYLINTNQAFCVNIVLNAPTFGSLAPQSAGPFTVKTIQSTSLIDGTSAPAVSADRDLSGFLSFDGISAVAGTQDQSTSAGNTSPAVTGTYVLTPTGNVDGSGTMTLSTPTGFTGYFFIISPTNAVMITTTPLDTNPVLIIIGH
ncbi:MAG TPA: putative Ig domain-containing protein [Candidatus Acidoferrales bacterium]|nr:putative Ig domain-containing protein [Candidatus Acidoferrales bacterium]